MRLQLVRASRGRALMGAAAGLVLVLGGCGTGNDTNAANDVIGQGYESGDGSTRTWPADSRGNPVELSGTDFAGNPVDIADWRGDVVVLNTWYAACPPCREEAPDLAAIAADYADRGRRSNAPSP